MQDKVYKKSFKIKYNRDISTISFQKHISLLTSPLFNMPIFQRGKEFNCTKLAKKYAQK